MSEVSLLPTALSLNIDDVKLEAPDVPSEMDPAPIPKRKRGRPPKFPKLSEDTEPVVKRVKKRKINYDVDEDGNIIRPERPRREVTLRRFSPSPEPVPEPEPPKEEDVISGLVKRGRGRPRKHFPGSSKYRYNYSYKRRINNAAELAKRREKILRGPRGPYKKNRINDPVVNQRIIALLETAVKETETRSRMGKLFYVKNEEEEEQLKEATRSLSCFQRDQILREKLKKMAQHRDASKDDPQQRPLTRFLPSMNKTTAPNILKKRRPLPVCMRNPASIAQLGKQLALGPDNETDELSILTGGHVTNPFVMRKNPEPEPEPELTILSHDVRSSAHLSQPLSIQRAVQHNVAKITRVVQGGQAMMQNQQRIKREDEGESPPSSTPSTSHNSPPSSTSSPSINIIHSNPHYQPALHPSSQSSQQPRSSPSPHPSSSSSPHTQQGPRLMSRLITEQKTKLHPNAPPPPPPPVYSGFVNSNGIPFKSISESSMSRLKYIASRISFLKEERARVRKNYQTIIIKLNVLENCGETTHNAMRNRIPVDAKNKQVLRIREHAVLSERTRTLIARVEEITTEIEQLMQDSLACM